MSQIISFGNGVIPPGTYIEQINGDVGSVSGSIISFNATPVSGSSLQFNGFGTTMLLEVTDASFNTLIGNSAGNGTLTGQFNTGLGYSNFFSLTTGSNNSSLGFGALQSLTTGNGNAAIGYNALASNNVGNRNVALGSGSLSSVTGDYNTAIGYNAGVSYVGNESGNIIINSSGSIGESNVLRIGENTGVAGPQDLNAVYIQGIRGISSATADQVLIINSVGKIISIAAGTTGQVLTSAGTGANPTWQTPSTSAVNYTSITTADSPYTVLTTDYYISADATAGPITVRLPNAPSTGRVFIVKDAVGIAATNNITLTTVGGAVTIDGSTSFVMNTAYESISVIFGGTNYEVF